eukprot:m.175013 g.175013  ORF g.175013 m.175013 type:complete len:1509 (+) comp15415_c0_seq4:169-4695(+)
MGTLKHPLHIKKVTVHKRDPTRRLFITAFFAVAYAIVVYQCVNTLGDPYRNALAEIESLRETGKLPDASWEFEDEIQKKQNKLHAIYGTGNTIEDEEFEEEEEEEEQVDPEEVDSEEGEDGKSPALIGNSTSEEAQKPPLPPWYLPNAFAAVGLFVVITMHILFHLLCHWLVWFEAMATFTQSDDVSVGVYIQVTPTEHRGRSAMCQVTRSQYTGDLVIEFQRQKYRYVAMSDGEYEKLDENNLTGEGQGAIVLIACPIDRSLDMYRNSEGIQESELGQARDQYGKNTLTLPKPNFLTLYKEQLLSPLAMFQFFTSALWMMDEYWQYTMFSLMNILIFESTTVWQRLKTLQTLSGMSSKPYDIHVYRNKDWIKISTEELLPGDIISLKRIHVPATPANNSNEANKENKKSPIPQGAPTDVVPCDCVLLRGSAVVNEATLTGESVPQMKDAIPSISSDNRNLDMNGRDRVHTLFSGTSLVSSIAPSSNASGSIPAPPDNGCVCFVLRTGFSSSQGELIQMIEFSTQQVSADAKETLMALGILLIFALISAGYVFHKGMLKGDRTTHELILKCVIIITSVVPQQLPMQMALAVNTALMALMKKGIFCTEPYRVQFAGKVSHCLFDKTGTLTTDQLVPAGCVCKTDKGVDKLVSDTKVGAALKLKAVDACTAEAGMVLAACQSLVYVEGPGMVGDPIELAGLSGVAWEYDAKQSKATPGTLSKLQAAITKKENESKDKKKELEPAGGSKGPEKDKEDSLAILKRHYKEMSEKCKKSTVKEVKIHHRHHFSSKLQRMSTVCTVTGQNGGRSGTCSLVKGSPEMIGTLLREDEKPEWYDRTHTAMAERGMRVLALAYKWMPDVHDTNTISKIPRQDIEKDLQLAGFVAFECKIRVDSPVVITALKESAHNVSMLTGDAPLTALHVAHEVGICDRKKGSLLLNMSKDGSPEWIGALSDLSHIQIDFQASKMDELKKEYNLVTTEAVLEEVAEKSNGDLWDHVDSLQVFARMSPQGKATVIRMLQERKKEHVLMCGDGGNDVGALKQADCGLALLGGYGNSNTEEVDKEAKKDAADAEEMLNKQVDSVQKKSKEIQKLVNEHMAKKRKELMTTQQEWLKEYIDQGEGYFGAIKKSTGRLTTELRKEQMMLQKKYGNAYMPKDTSNPLADLEAESDAMMPVVRPGDASVAAPFTTRVPSVRSCVDLIRQGRCTLLSALQQQQIMMLQCIISAYTLSAISLEGARSSERQMMASSWLILTASLAFSYSTPIDKMSEERPIKSLFHPAIFISMLGQAAIHLGCMIYAVNLATETMGPEALKKVVDFNKALRAGEDVTPETDEEDQWAEFMALWTRPFLPNLMNTVVFLVETSQIMAVLLVNYKGRPWMKGIIENHALCLSLFITIAAVCVCAWGVSPELNAMIHLEPFPDDEFRWKVVALVLITFLGAFIWDRLITMIFAPSIFKAMLDEGKKTTPADLVPVFMTLGKVVGGVAIFASGNILLWGGVIYYYWSRRKAQ